jgi:adenosylcobinamide-GDP ribazoletransferase
MDEDDQPFAFGLSELLFEALLALATLTFWPLVDERSCGTTAQRARALMFLPFVGLILGVLLALVDRWMADALGPGARSLVVMVVAFAATLGLGSRGLADTADSLRLGSRPPATGIMKIGPVGALIALVAFAIEVLCLAKIADPAGRASALVMAFLLSRWTIVPIGYGLKPIERWGLGVPYEGGITFREFAVSSVVALGLVMGLYQNVGLAVIVVLALLILAMRLLFSRRLGGAPGFALAGASAMAELVVVALLAALRV